MAVPGDACGDDALLASPISGCACVLPTPIGVHWRQLLGATGLLSRHHLSLRKYRQELAMVTPNAELEAALRLRATASSFRSIDSHVGGASDVRAADCRR